jgi:hypothetical protein
MSVVCTETGLITEPVFQLTTASPVPDFLENQNEDDVFIPSLPALHRGHPDVHLRNGVMNAYRMSALNEPDAERAFFVADLSQVYRQHERWGKHLPEVKPFYGQWFHFWNDKF